jgi:hypothetical protein
LAGNEREATKLTSTALDGFPGREIAPMTNEQRWILFLLTRNPAFLPDPVNVVKESQRASVDRIWRRFEAIRRQR